MTGASYAPAVRDVAVIGVAMTQFGKAPSTSVRSLAAQAVDGALRDAGVEPADVGMTFFANAAQGILDGQEMIRGQAALRHTGLLGMPIVNVENACASSASAFHLAWMSVASGMVDVAVAVGAEKLTHPDKSRSFAAIGTALDQAEPPTIGNGLGGHSERSVFMDVYAAKTRHLIERAQVTAADIADVAVKNRSHAVHNPVAHFRDPVDRSEVLKSRPVVPPLTLLMCSPISDGAAAVVLAAADIAQLRGSGSVRVRATTLVSGTDDPEQSSAVERAAHRAFNDSGVEPNDCDVVELHDATASAELMLYEELGMCPPGAPGALLSSGATALGGRQPVNPSGGLLARGHPIGATGCAQIVEVTQQLRGRCGVRQVEGARVGLAQNGGGFLGSDVAAAAVTILSR